jgi:hypothetical protein
MINRFVLTVVADFKVRDKTYRLAKHQQVSVRMDFNLVAPDRGSLRGANSPICEMTVTATLNAAEMCCTSLLIRLKDPELAAQ